MIKGQHKENFTYILTVRSQDASRNPERSPNTRGTG